MYVLIFVYFMLISLKSKIKNNWFIMETNYYNNDKYGIQ